MTNRNRSVSAQPISWRKNKRAFLRTDYEHRLRSDDRARQAFDRLRRLGARDIDIEEMIWAFALIPLCWYSDSVDVAINRKGLRRSAKFLEKNVAANLALSEFFNNAALAEELMQTAELLHRQPLDRYAFRCVIGYLYEAIPSKLRRRRPMKEAGLIVSAMLNRKINPNRFQHDVVLKALWPSGTYVRTK